MSEGGTIKRTTKGNGKGEEYRKGRREGATRRINVQGKEGTGAK